MKKSIVCIALIALISLLCVFGQSAPQGQEDYLRVHIRAHSNDEEDQAVKYAVRDAVVRYLTPVVAQSESKEDAIQAVQAHLQGVEETAVRTLRELGFSYGAKAQLKREQFPTRIYDGRTLAAGVYDALILSLGTGKGDNWWCVVYPPLCFTGAGGNVLYKSKILEIIQRFYGQE